MRYTKANISSDTLFWIFGVGYGFADCSTYDMNELAEEVDNYYPTKQSIINAINNFE